MVTPALNSFSTFNLTERESLDACILNQLQKMWLQNLKADVAERLISLEFDTTNPLQRLAEDAELKGQLKILNYILITSAESEQQLMDLASNAASDFE